MNRPLFYLLCLTSCCLTIRAEEGLVLPFKQVAIGSPVDGIIKEMSVEEGDTVKEGQIIAKLASEAEQLEVSRTQKLIEKTSFDQKASASLLKERMTSQEQALTKEIELQIAKIMNATAEFHLSQKTITSPMPGIVVKKYKETGETVVLHTDKLVDIVNIDKVYLQFYIDPELMDRLKRGTKVQVKFPTLAEDKDHIAEVSFIDPRIDASSGLIRVKLIMDNPGHRIRTGMRVEADFRIFVKAAK
jgi:membrane fusion protein, multidrug efflux system